MTKSRITILNATTSLIRIFSSCILGLIFTFSILNHFGSDCNGVNSAILQIVNTLMVLEGGFLLASNVALYHPLAQKDYRTANGILSATRVRFLLVGILMLFLGTILSIIYPFLICTSMQKRDVFFLAMTVVIPSSVNVAFFAKYRVLILAAQKEYVISTISVATYTIGMIFAILMIQIGFDIVSARICIMLFTLLGCFLIMFYCKTAFNYINYSSKPLYEEIKGTGSVVFLKITSLLYTSAPIILISTIPKEGTLLASVYAVYKGILQFVSGALTALCSAPRLSFGALFAEKRNDRIANLFEKYEMLTCIGLTIILSSVCILIFPFVEFYTKNVSDMDYKNIPLAAILILTALLEVIHIPSGQIIQMKGDFVASRKIQSFACISLIISMSIGRMYFGAIGIICSVLIAAGILAVLEIYYTSRFILKRSFSSFILNVLPCVCIILISLFYGFSLNIHINSYAVFFVWGVCCLMFFSIITLTAYYILRKRELVELISIITKTLPRSSTKTYF